MENASKALIIAGAILISILLIAVGVYVLNNGMDMAKQSNLSAEQIQQYNTPFTTYEGTSVKGSQARALCEKIETHNRTMIGDDESKVIDVVSTDPGDGVTTNDAPDKDTAESIKGNATTVKGTIKSGYTYEIKFLYDSNSGLVTKVSIVKK